MLVDIENMDGYEFEGFIAELLRKIGFVVEETPLSGDSGVDLIAYSKEPLYKGKYLIQCKRWEGNIGEPAVRDLYGVVLSNNANKGIIITNSFFTQQAVEFADGKNIELIDGNILNNLINEYFSNTFITKNSITAKTHFTKAEGFELNKYIYYKQIVDTNKRSLDAYLDLFNFIYNYIESKNMKIMYSGLIEECILLCEEIIKRFGVKGKKGIVIKGLFSRIKGTLLMLLGQIDDAYEMIHKIMEFNKQNFTYNLVGHYFYFYPEHYTYTAALESKEEYRSFILERGLLIHKTNMLNMLVYINDEYSSKWLYDKYISYYNFIKNAAYEENEIIVKRKQLLIDVANKNYKLVNEQIESVMSKNKLKLFLPESIIINDKDPIYSGLTYSINSFLYINDIVAYWSSNLDFEKQKEKIKFLISLNE
ncbi:restriction endonuclease [Syntrophomonas wolfei]|uniref:Restriction endonuclease-like protein n=1 Tax=Syntrophomonas wolfei subsp. wolfei (strain DSM 2245B / Goettingen) TaxID=335541 RepID=Q0AY97_SYNWW|nr:restriction endonuclease [Syntrophomonas wolfei]ABI68307.1 Restriction endonuclease-like protein [Syntrophomonas wolfei subsp. wolfei str. Goettingen G311]